VLFRAWRRGQERAAISVVPASPRSVVVTAFPLKTPGRAKLAEQLGDVEILDIRDAVYGADLVLAPSCSPQCVAALRSAYPSARIVVVELEDWDFEVNLPGPVKRVLKAGADAYLLADSIEQLAQQLRPRSERPADEASKLSEARLNELAQSSVDTVIFASLRDVLERRQDRPGPPREADRPPWPAE
jgi:DNA-binding NarL/FixJ family response regulator